MTEKHEKVGYVTRTAAVLTGMRGVVEENEAGFV